MSPKPIFDIFDRIYGDLLNNPKPTIWNHIDLIDLKAY